MAKITAVIDIGSNSVRMAIFKKSSHLGFVLLKEIKSRVRISEGAYENNSNLQPHALERATATLKEFQHIIRTLKARKTLIVATSAVRDAPNKAEFIQKVKQKTGLKIKVIHGEKESFYGGVAAGNLLPQTSGITIDIGGGSTEFARIENSKVVEAVSLNIGTVRLKELFFDKKNIEGAVAYIKEELSKLPKSFRGEHIFGIGGTIRSLSKVIMQKEAYPLDILHAFDYTIADYEALYETIIHAGDYTLLRLGFKKERLDVIREGVLILSQATKLIGAKKLVTSGVGVREGVFLSDLLRNLSYVFPKNFNPSVRAIEDTYEIDKLQSAYEVKIAMSIFEQLKEVHGLDDRFKMHLKYAIKLSTAGEYIDYYGSFKHTHYLLLNSLHYGFTHEDRILISMIIHLHRKKRIKKEHINFYKQFLPTRMELEYLCQIFWLTKTLNFNTSKACIDCKYEEGELKIRGKELYLAKEKIANKRLMFKLSLITDFSVCF